MQQYARSTVYDPDHNKLFVGISTQREAAAHRRGAAAEVEDITPPGTTAKDFIDLDYAAAASSPTPVAGVVDAVTGEQVKFTDAATGTQVMDYPIAARGVSAAGPGGVYFTNNTLALTYDLDTNTVGPVSPPRTVTRGASIGYGWVTENGSQVLYSLAELPGGTFRAQPAGRHARTVELTVPVRPGSAHARPRGPRERQGLRQRLPERVDLVYDPRPASPSSPPPGPGRGLGLGQHRQDVRRHLPVRPAVGSECSRTPTRRTQPRRQPPPEPARLGQAAGNSVYVGTTPAYGEYSGALTVYDVPTGAFTVYRNLVADQTISSLLPVGAGLWAGSSIEGGQGTEPIATEAHLVKVDPSTGAVLTDVVPVPGAASINELIIGPDGNLWGRRTASCSSPTRQPVRYCGRSRSSAAGPAPTTVHCRGGTATWRDWRTTVRREQPGGVSTMLRDHGLNRLTQTPDGTYYTLLRPDGWTNPTNLASYTAPVDPCPRSDLRATVGPGTSTAT